MRKDANDRGIHGLVTQLTISAPLVNKTLFDQAGARFAGPSLSMGAKYFAADGSPAVVDDGFKAMASRYLKWAEDGTVEKDVWVAVGGGYRDASAEFANGKIAMYLSGSWQLARLEKQIGDGFEWVIGDAPCGPGGCTGMPGGANLLPSQRPYVGAANFASLLDCTNHFDANSRERDMFWHGVWNTLRFVLIQVGLMLGFSLLTAIVLNKKIIGRSFFGAAFFYPVLLSPVVVALIWKWILQREGLLNAAMIGAGADQINWLLDGNWAFFWSVFVSIWAHMGFYTLILLAGLQAIPAEIKEASQMDATLRARAACRPSRRRCCPMSRPASTCRNAAGRSSCSPSHRASTRVQFRRNCTNLSQSKLSFMTKAVSRNLTVQFLRNWRPTCW